MALPIWLSLLTAVGVISLTPGAGAINTMTNSLNVGWRRSAWGVLGQQIALLVHIAVVAAGVGVLVAGSPMLFNAIRYLGAAYLVYLGVRMLLARPRASDGDDSAAAAIVPRGPGAPDESAWSLVQRGIWVNLLNPKAIVFFLAFLPQFIRPGQPLLPQYAALTATVLIVDVIVMLFFFAAAARPFRGFAATVRGQRIMNSVFGALFIGVAGLMLFVH